MEDHTQLLGAMHIRLKTIVEVKRDGEGIMYPVGMVLPAQLLMKGRVIQAAYITSPYGTHELHPLDFNVHHGSSNGTA